MQAFSKRTGTLQTRERSGEKGCAAAPSRSRPGGAAYCWCTAASLSYSTARTIATSATPFQLREEYGPIRSTNRSVYEGRVRGRAEAASGRPCRRCGKLQLSRLESLVQSTSPKGAIAESAPLAAPFVQASTRSPSLSSKSSFFDLESALAQELVFRATTLLTCCGPLARFAWAT